MSGFTKPSIQNVDTTNPRKGSAVDAANAVATRTLQSPDQWAQWFGSFGPDMSGLRASANANPEGDALSKLAPLLMALAGKGNGFSELQFGNQFSELANPYGSMGAMNPAFGTIAAQTPIFDRNLQAANARLSAIAPGRFSSAIAQEGAGLNAQALQDFNLFANQALQQGLQTQLQERQANLNFLLGARGLQQDEVQNVRGSQISARGLQQGAEAEANNRALQAYQQYGNLAGQAGMNQFNRQQGLVNAGFQAQQNQINPILQMLLAALQYGNPESITPIVGQSPLGTILGAAGTAIGIGSNLGWQPFGNKPPQSTIPQRRG